MSIGISIVESLTGTDIFKIYNSFTYRRGFMKFEELLKKWNKGILRGAQLRLAKSLGIDQSAIRRWMEGITTPAEKLRPKIAKELGVTVEVLMESLKSASTSQNAENVIRLKEEFNVEEWEFLVDIINDIRAKEGLDVKPADVFRRLVRMFRTGQLVPAGSPSTPSGPIDDIGHVQRNQFESEEPMPQPKANESK
jgi:transcriptional regulator with XRE-family HTH domain